MASSTTALSIIFLLCLSIPSSATTPNYDLMLQCLSNYTPPNTNLTKIMYSPSNPSFSNLLRSSIKNLLFATPNTHQPSLILLPSDESHVRASVICCKAHNLPIRIRSGGHDYEGLSYRSTADRPFAILDLSNLRSIEIDTQHHTATVHSGATLGELYYSIAQTGDHYAFPAGICPTVGVGGHITGGGFGTMLRKHGLASDNVVDAEIVTADGRLLDRQSMGEDLFWAIRGGGGASFGVVTSFKLTLVPVPSTVTVFTIYKTLPEGATRLIEKWQRIAPKLDENLFIRVVIQTNGRDGGDKEVVVLFNSLFLGRCSELIQVMRGFPELGFDASLCNEMSWAQSLMHFAYYEGKPLEALLDRGTGPERFFKAKADYVTEPIPRFVFDTIWPRFLEDGAGVMIMEPFGGKMSSISESATPFPRRDGILLNIQYFVEWRDGGDVETQKRVGWIESLYRDMGPYVLKGPRAAYVNYKDLDLGSNGDFEDGTSYDEAAVWGLRYFGGNFERLARVKGSVDPDDFFRNEQSIPPLGQIGLLVDLNGYDSYRKPLDVM